MRGYKPHCLVATAAANTGIDQPKCVYVLHVGIPRCIVELLQERGRLVRVDGMSGSFVIYCDWYTFIKLLVSILRPRQAKTAEVYDHEFVNSAIVS